MNKMNYNVSGIQNSEIKTQFKNSLEKIDRISMINIDAGRSLIEVGSNESTNESPIKSCIEKVGCKIVSV